MMDSIAKEKWLADAIEEGRADFQSGRFVSHEEAGTMIEAMFDEKLLGQFSSKG
ncbi:MAG: hypothetical protein R8J84_00925 [Mariprofundales bacterium]